MAHTEDAARLALLEAEVAELRRVVSGSGDMTTRRRRSGAWRQRSAVLAGVAMAGAVVMGVAVASTPGNPADVSFIALSVPHKILSNASIGKGATNSVVVNGGSTTVPTDATSVQMTVAVKSTAAGSLSVFPADHAASTSADTISFAAGVATTQVTKQSPGLSSKVSFKNNGTATAVVTVTITGYSTQTTASNISGAGGSAGQVLTNNGTGGALWQSVPSDITYAHNNPCCSGGNPYTGVAFLTAGHTLTFAGPQTAVLVTGTADLASSDGNNAQGNFGVCYQSLPSGGISYVSNVFPQFAAAPYAFFAQSMSGVVSGLPAGQYKVGLCAGTLTTNMVVGQRVDAAVRFTVNTSAPQAPIHASAPLRTNQVH